MDIRARFGVTFGYLTKGGKDAVISQSRREAYPSDLTDKEWQILEPLIPPPKPGGRPRKYEIYEIREIVNAIFYVLRSGCSWRMLPHDFPDWQAV